MTTIQITHWQGLRVPHGGRREALTWGDLCRWLSPDPPPPYHGEGSPRGVSPLASDFDPGHPGWSPATFRGDYRGKDRIAEIGALTTEHDAGTISIQAAIEILTRLGLACIIITTKSHTPDQPRWRLVVLLSRSVSVGEREALYQLAMGWGLDLAQAESHDAARFWYTTCRGDHEDSGRAAVVDGAPLDVDRVLAAIPPPPPSPTPSPAPSSPHEVAPYIRSALDKAHQAITGAGKGARHAVTAQQAYALGGLVGGGSLSQHEAERVLRSAVIQAWADDPREADADGWRTARTQLQEGAKKPRYVEPPSRPSPATSRGSAMPALATSPAPTPTPTPAHLRAVPDDASPLAETIAGIKTSLLRSSSGAPRKVVANAITILALDPRWSGVLAYQALSDRVVKLIPPPWHEHDAPATSEAGPWTDADTTRAQAWLSREYGLDLGAESVNASVLAVAERRVIDPLKDYFESIRGTWDGSARVDVWLSAVFNAPDTPYSRAIGRRWLISCVARALRPGCKVDHVLVLEGLQGKKKSTALERLCPSPDLFFDSELQIGDKDAIQVLRGKWIVELGEVDKMSRHDLSILKAFITRKVDTYRPSFGRRPIDAPRRFVFSGSTNEQEYLKDPTGNRRWWPVHCPGPIDIPALEACRDQLWAEALHLFESGAPWWLESDELADLARVEQEAREQTDPWEERVAAHLAELVHKAGPTPAEEHAHECRCVRCHGVTTSAVLGAAVGLGLDKQGRSEETRVGTILRALGWAKAPNPIRRDGARVRPYFPPADPPGDTSGGPG